MQFGKVWKLFDMSFVYKGRSDPHNALFCAKPLADAVMEGNHSILLPDQDLEYEHTLGSCLLEFLLLNPIFEGKTIEDIHDLVAIEDLVQRVHALPEATQTDERFIPPPPLSLSLSLFIFHSTLSVNTVFGSGFVFFMCD